MSSPVHWRDLDSSYIHEFVREWTSLCSGQMQDMSFDNLVQSLTVACIVQRMGAGLFCSSMVQSFIEGFICAADGCWNAFSIGLKELLCGFLCAADASWDAESIDGQ